MSEYIDRESIRRVLMDVCSDENCPMFIAATVDQMIDYEPATDVAPVVHGHWTLERDPDDGNKPVCYHCSVCDSNGCHTSIRIAYKYCPNCGAKMDGGDTDV